MPASPATNNETCFYEVLGVARDATTDDINAAFRNLARKHHPDRHVNASDAEKSAQAEAFKAVSQAADVLSDPEKRTLYDTFGHAGAEMHRSADDSAAQVDDAAAQAMFEQMYMHANESKRARGKMGGALFVDERGRFFQRREMAFHDIEKMRREMTDGLPIETQGGTSSHTSSVALPAGAWEVRLVEVCAETATVRVTLAAGDAKDGDEADDRKALRLERTFELPKEGQVELASVDVSVDEERGVLLLTAPKRRVEAMAEEDPTGHHNEEEPTFGAYCIGADATPVSKKAPNRAARRRASKTHKSGLRAGFFNTPPPSKGSGVEPMDVDEIKENVEVLPVIAEVECDGC